MGGWAATTQYVLSTPLVQLAITGEERPHENYREAQKHREHAGGGSFSIGMLRPPLMREPPSKNPSGPMRAE